MFDLDADPGLQEVLHAMSIGPSDYLGHGGEAWVGALGIDRVVRVLHPGGDSGELLARQALVDELEKLRPRFAMPRLIERRSLETQSGWRHFSIEQRLQGESVLSVLPTLDRSGRDGLVRHYLESIQELGRLDFRRHFYGDLFEAVPGGGAVREAHWAEWLERKTARSLGRAGVDFAALNAMELIEALPSYNGPGRFLHLDAYPGNVMTVGATVTAVIDIGVTSAVGDPRLDLLTAAVYLCTPNITPTADQGDSDACRQWIADQGLSAWFEPTRRWVAAFWAWAVDDAKLHHWCRQTLLGS